MNENIDIAKDLSETLEEALNDCLFEGYSFDSNIFQTGYCSDSGEELFFNSDSEAVNHALNSLSYFEKVKHMKKDDIVTPVFIDDELKYYIPFTI